MEILGNTQSSKQKPHCYWVPKALIIKNGGTIATSVKTATVLLAKDPSGGSSKLDAARALGTRILTEQQFRTKYGL